MDICPKRPDLILPACDRYALAPKLVIREPSSQSGEAEDLQMKEKKFCIDRKMHALQQVGTEMMLYRLVFSTNPRLPCCIDVQEYVTLDP